MHFPWHAANCPPGIAQTHWPCTRFAPSGQSAQLPWLQYSEAQVRPQTPQFVGSVSESTQPVGHTDWSVAQTHEADSHVDPGGQTWSQSPQLLESVRTARQVPPHNLLPAAQGETQRPDWHVSPLAHLFWQPSHELAQLPPQGTVPGAQDMPASTDWSPASGRPRSTHTPDASQSWPAAHSESWRQPPPTHRPEISQTDPAAQSADE